MIHIRSSSTLRGILTVALVSLSPVMYAQTVPGSNILTNADVGDISAELGQGPLDLTRIFSHVNGDGKTFLDFHSAADGQGPTFSVFEVTSIENLSGTYVGLPIPYVIVGYDPQSWDSTSGFHRTFPNSERTAFLYNLTLGLVLDQVPNNGEGVNDFGSYQTMNLASYGPNFGGGYDFGYETSQFDAFEDVDVIPLSYGTPTTTNTPSQEILGLSYGTHATVSDMEIFTFTDNSSTTPEPGSLGLLSGLVLTGLGVFARRKRK